MWRHQIRRGRTARFAMGLLVAMSFLGTAGLHAQDPEAPSSVQELEAEVRALEAAGDRSALASAHNSLGLLHWNEARYPDAVDHLSRARDIWAELGDVAALGRVYNNLGAAHYQWGNFEAALDAFFRARSYRQEAGDLRGQALVLTNVGRTYVDWEQFQDGRAFLEEALEVAIRSRDAFARGYALHNLGILELEEGDFPAARNRFEESLTWYSTDHPGITPEDAESGWALNTLGMAGAFSRAGSADDAVPLLEEALDRAEQDDHARRQIRALVQLGETHRIRGDLERSVSYLNRALTLSREVEQRTLALDALAELATVHEARQAPAEALRHLSAYQALRDSIFSQSATQRIASMEARAEAERQERENLRLLDEQRAQQAIITRQRLVGILGAAFLLLAAVLVTVLVRYNRNARNREELVRETNALLEDRNRELEALLSEVQALKGLIPICVHCKNVRDDRGFWEGVETYISNRSEALFSHSICTECGPKVYGEDWSPEAAAASASETVRADKPA